MNCIALLFSCYYNMNKEFAQIVKRLVDLFPNYTHKIHLNWFMDGLQDSLSLLGIETSSSLELREMYVNVKILTYTPAQSIGVVSYREFLLNGQIEKYEITQENKHLPLFIRIEPPHPEWEPFDLENLYVPKLQVRIFKAIHGEKWHQCVKIAGRVYFPLVKSKLM